MQRLAWIPMVLALAAWEPLRSPDPDVEAGNRAYAAGRLDEAIAAYERARDSGVDVAGLDYNLGTARLRLAEQAADEATRDQARKEGLADLDRAAKSRDPALRAQARFNAGNAHRAAGNLDQAIESYKQALRDDPEHLDARTNLELTLRDQQQDQQQQGGQGQPPPQGGQGQGQPPPQGGQGQGQQPPPQGGQGQGQQPPPQGGQGQDPPPDADQGSGAPPKDPGQGSGSQGQGDPPPKPGDQGSGAEPPQDDPGDDPGSSNKPPQHPSGKRGLPSRGKDQEPGPSTPADEKLEDLEESAREVRRNHLGDRIGGKRRGNDW